MKQGAAQNLRIALGNLRIFLDAHEEKTFFFRRVLAVKNGKILIFRSSILSNCFFRIRNFLLPPIPPAEIIEVLKITSETIQNNSILLHLWEEGCPDQKEFCSSLKSTVSRFNQWIEAHSALGLKKIDLFPRMRISALSSSQLNFQKMTLSKSTADTFDKKVVQIREPILSTQKKELFMMKAITLLETNGLAAQEARLIVRKGFWRELGRNREGVHRLSLVLKPYERRTIEIQGAFLGKVPLPETFQILTSQ